jgi:uncharacterized protein
MTMLFLLSPAKSLDFDRRVPAAVARRITEPRFLPQAAELIDVMRRQSAAQVATLMDLSPALTALNVERYASWRATAVMPVARPAVLAFDGDVYGGLDAKTLTTADLDWAQAHLVLLSGLYGALQPLDLIQPHRLEMGTAVQTRLGKDLYAFWGDSVAAYLNGRLAAATRPLIINLASQEYARVALRPALAARVIDCQFEDRKDGRYKVISFFAKRARGLIARFAVQQRLRSAAGLKAFDTEGYKFDAAASTPERFVFRRRLE